jgi:hypothetical protein
LSKGCPYFTGFTVLTILRFIGITFIPGPDVRSDILGMLCGSGSGTYTSSTNEVVINFHTDASGTDQGFQVTYFAMEKAG